MVKSGHIMNLQDLLNSQQAGRLALWVSRRIPPHMGQGLARVLANWIASQDSLPLVQAVRANQWVAGGEQLSADQLDRVVRDTICSLADSFYTLFHYLDDPAAMQAMIEYSPQAKEVIARDQKSDEGAIVVGVHMSNFDLVAQTAAHHGLRALAISVPQPDQAVEWQHNIRRNAGIEILPASMANIRQAIKRLQGGEIVLTGLDRPIPDPKYRPRFFGRPANVPVHYVQLALKARVPVVVMAAVRQDDGVYQILSSDYIYLEPNPDRKMEMEHNAERVLSIAEDFIRQAPQQWAIFQPVWPEVQELVPR